MTATGVDEASYLHLPFVIHQPVTIMRRLYALLSLLLLSSITVTAQGFDTIRVCTYNILRFGATSNDRIDELKKILNEIRPEILLIQELASEEGFNLFRDSVAAMLDVPLLALPFRENPDGAQDSYVAIFLDGQTMTSNNIRLIPDTPRLMAGSYLRHRASGDSLFVITGHWKAGETSEDRALRLQSAQSLIRILSLDVPPFFPKYENVLFGGDLNVYSADEPAYQALVISDTSKLDDPIRTTGTWHENDLQSIIHTQSTRDRQFGGGVGGGLDDRFDQILLSPQLMEHFSVISYTTYGNDGMHFNDSINAPPSFVYPPTMMQALHDASDHLPVYLDLVFPRVTTGVEGQEKEEAGLDLVERSE